MLVCDFHCDLPYKVLKCNETLRSDSTHWSLKKLKNDNYIQFFASYVDKFETDNPYLYIDKMLDKFISLVDDCEDIEIITNKETFVNKKASDF